MLTNFDPSLWTAAKAPQIDATGNLVANTGDAMNGISINGQTSPYGAAIANNNSKDFAPRLAEEGKTKVAETGSVPVASAIAA